MLFANSSDLPIIAELDEYSPATVTRLHARGGELIGEFATERRTILKYDDIPEVLRNAIIAAEDGDFFDHVGISVPRVLATMVSNVLKGDLTAAGASTITMQLARNVTLSSGRLGGEKSWQRKIREIFYTLYIEKRYTNRDFRFACPGWLRYTSESRRAHEILFVAPSSSSRGRHLSPR